ncbi:MAG: hypothetical protein PHG25_00015 [Candidatus Pacebacteria bacterium]|nr:hypothetical protein [Candidatus Paceibacterota bacterium]
MLKGTQIIQQIQMVFEICGGWWSAMSGAISIPFGFIALFAEGNPRTYFAALAFIALWVFAIGVVRKNYKILVIQKPERTRALLTKMVDSIRSEKPIRTGSVANDYWRSMQPADPIGALIKFSDEIQSEDDLKWLCGEFIKLGYVSPFKPFEPQLGKDVAWLPILKEARLNQHEIKDQGRLLQFLALTWTGKEMWKQGQARVTANPTLENETVSVRNE